MNVLIACEYSGALRNAFLESGHNAVSCDLLPGELINVPGTHYKGDVFDLLKGVPGFPRSWDMLIAFPPCQYLAQCQMYRYKDKARREERDKAVLFVRRLFDCGISKICIENPIGYLNTHWRKPDQIISPHLFGDAYHKKICFWLKGLDSLYVPILVNSPGKLSPGKLSPGKLKRTSNHVNSRMSSGLKSKIKSSWIYFPHLIESIIEQWAWPNGKTHPYLRPGQLSLPLEQTMAGSTINSQIKEA